MGLPLEAPKSVSSTGTPHLLGDDWETPGTQTTLYEFPSFNLVWEHLAGLSTTINNHPWGIAWYGSEGIIMMNDAGWEVIPERRQANLDPEKHKGSGNPRPAHIRNFLDCVKTFGQHCLPDRPENPLECRKRGYNQRFHGRSVGRNQLSRAMETGLPAPELRFGLGIADGDPETNE
jgi:hypothetical protein